MAPQVERKTRNGESSGEDNRAPRGVQYRWTNTPPPVFCQGTVATAVGVPVARSRACTSTPQAPAPTVREIDRVPVASAFRTVISAGFDPPGPGGSRPTQRGSLKRDKRVSACAILVVSAYSERGTSQDGLSLKGTLTL